MATAHEEIVTEIIKAQAKVMGPVAVQLAGKVPGVSVSADGATSIAGDGVAAIEGVVSAFSGVTGKLGIRMCYTAAKPALERHPDVAVPSFAGM